jgi:AcrR family transcriptional regulator
MVSDAPTTDARQVRTRAKLLRAMLTLLERGPFEAITVRALAAEAGVGYATFFRHYASKEALLDDLAADEIAGLLARAMPLLSAENSRSACVALFEAIAPRKTLWRALLAGGAAPLLRAQFIAQARALAASSPAAALPSTCPLDLRVTFATSATLEIIGWWLSQPEELPIATIAGILDRLAITPTLAER